MSDPWPPGDEPGAGNSEFTPSEEGLDELVHMAFADDLGSASTPRDTPPRTFRDLLGLTGGLPDGIDGPGRALKPGDRLGPYRIEREVGRGGFGVVHLAVKEGLGLRVALKVPRPDLVQNAGLWDNLARDARLAARLNHPAIVAIHDAGPLEGTFHIASQFVAGENLYHYLKRHPGGLPIQQVLAIGRVLADALAHAHAENVVHWDLNPANVLIEQGRRDDAFPAVLITDFGLGKHLAEQAGQSATISRALRGTAPYIAPEFLLGASDPVDRRADLYGLGAILYEALTGRPIYRARSSMDLMILLGKGEPPLAPRRLRTGISRDLETVVLGCLDHDPASRYQAASEVREELTRVASDLPIRRRRRSALENLAQWARRKPALAALAGVTAAAVVLLLLLSIRLAYSVREATDAKNQYQRAAGDLAASNRETQKALDGLRESQEHERAARYASDLHSANAALIAHNYDITLLNRFSHRMKEMREDQRVTTINPISENDLQNEGQAGASHQYEVAQRLLAGHRPKPGQTDHREFAWRYLWGQACQIYEVKQLTDLAWWRPSGGFTGFDPAAMTHLEVSTKILPEFFSCHWGRSAWYSDGELRRISRGAGPGAPTFFEEAGQLVQVHLPSNLDPPDLPYSRFAWSPDKVTLVSASLRFEGIGNPPPIRRREIKLPWSERATVPAKRRQVLSVAEIPEGHLLTISDDGRMIGLLIDPPGVHPRPAFYDLSTDWRAIYPEKARWYFVEWKTVTMPTARDRRVPTQLALSRDGRLAALTSHTPKVEVFETRTGRTCFTTNATELDPHAYVTCLAFSPDELLLVTGHDTGDVMVWELSSGRMLARFLPLSRSITFVSFYPDAETIAIVAGDETIRLWDYRPLALRPSFNLLPPPLDDSGSELWDITFADNGQVLVSADDRHRIKITDTATQNEKRTLFEHPTQVSAIAISSDGHTLASGDYDGGLLIRDLDQTAAPKEIGLLQGMVRSMAWSPDGRYLAVCGRAPVMIVWDRQTGEARHVPTPHLEASSLTWSPDGRTLAVGSQGRQITFWRMPETTLLEKIEGFPVASLAWSPDGHWLAAGTNDGSLVIFDANTSAVIHHVKTACDQGGIWDLAFSPDGKTLATGGDDKLVRLWDPASGHELLRLEGHESKVHAVAFSPDGKTLASGDFAGNLRLWRAAVDQ